MLPAIINFVHYVGLYFYLLRYPEMTIVAFFQIYIFIGKTWSMRRIICYSEDEANIKCALEVFTD